MDFSPIASTYDFNGLVQKDSAKALFEIANIQPGEDVLDVGCGPGFLTALAKAQSGGRAVGADPSPGMLEEARKKHAGENIEWILKSAEEIDYENEFGVILCNSAFQWVKNADKAARNFYTALREGGRMALQSPAKKVFCAEIIKAIDEIATHPATRDTFAFFRNPWLFLETEERYSALFSGAGFNVKFCSMALDERIATPEEAFRVFSSGAAMAYLNKDCYAEGFSKEYADKFGDIMMESFKSQAGPDGRLKLAFNRIYILAEK